MTTINAKTINDLGMLFGSVAELEKSAIRRIIELLSSDLNTDPIPDSVRTEVLALREPGAQRAFSF
jgi:hypothetical protein